MSNPVPQVPTSSALRPLALVLAFGMLMGLIPALVAIASKAGVGASSFACLQALGGGLLLLIWCGVKRAPLRFSAHDLRYYAVSGLTGIALPNQLFFIAVPHLGSGLTSLTYCFPSLMTLAYALATGMERPDWRRIGGIVLGFGSTVLIVLPQGGMAASPAWLGIAMACPLSLAFGNIYRSRDWPPGANPLTLAAGMLLAGGLWLVPLMLWIDPLAPLASIPVLITGGLSILLTAVSYAMFLELQRIAGPVTLSQVGYVITATGLIVGVNFLDEQYGPWVWIAVAGVFAGVALTTLPTFKRKPA